MKPHAFSAALVLAAAGFAQQTLVVSSSGGGSYTDIQQAIAAAAPNDIVLVRAGRYSPFTLDKGLRVIGEPGAIVGDLLAFFGVSNVPAGQVAVVRGIEPGVPSRTVEIHNNQGLVLIDGLDAPGGVRITGSRHVSLRRVEGFAGGGAALFVERSVVAASECSFTGVQGLFGAMGLDVVDATVTWADGSLVGAKPPHGIAFPGARLQSGSLTIAGDASTVVAAGLPSATIGSAAIIAMAGQLRIDPEVTLTPSGGSPAVEGAAEVTFRTTPSTRAEVLNGQLVVDLRAPGADSGHLVASAPLNPPIALPFGQLWVSTNLVLLDSGPIGPNGHRTATIALPPLPLGTAAALQWAVVRGAALELSTPVLPTLDT